MAGKTAARSIARTRPASPRGATANRPTRVWPNPAPGKSWSGRT